MCMSCVANCQRESPELNLRPIGIDYGLPWLLPKAAQSDSTPLSQVETNFWLGGIICILQGGVLLHYLPKILADIGMDPFIATAAPTTPEFATHAILSFAVLGFPGGLSFVADKASVPLESAWRVARRQLTRTPAENAAIKTLYEAMVNQNADVSTAIKEWDQDGDGFVSDWEMKEAFKLLKVPSYEFEMLYKLLRSEGEAGSSVSTLFDNIQELYFDVLEAERESKGIVATYKSQIVENDFETKLTFIELFNRLDRNSNGYVTKEEFATMSDCGYFKRPLKEEELNRIFDEADIFGTGRLNLFEFMGILRKNVKVGIQEIGYGYLPLAWGSLTAYWLGLGMQELG